MNVQIDHREGLTVPGLMEEALANTSTHALCEVVLVPYTDQPGSTASWKRAVNQALGSYLDTSLPLQPGLHVCLHYVNQQHSSRRVVLCPYLFGHGWNVLSSILVRRHIQAGHFIVPDKINYEEARDYFAKLNLHREHLIHLCRAEAFTV